MNLKFKNELLTYLKQHDDGSQTAREIINRMTGECSAADCSCLGINNTDLMEILDDNIFRNKVKRVLGAKTEKECNAPFSPAECEKIMGWYTDTLSETFREALLDVIAEHVIWSIS